MRCPLRTLNRNEIAQQVQYIKKFWYLRMEILALPERKYFEAAIPKLGR
jgi:hypothetical protein